MLGLSRAFLTFRTAILVQPFADLASADPGSDRPFFVRWAVTANNQNIFGVHFFDV
jgi:hypothetical protein